MIEDIQPRQDFRAFVVKSDGYTVTLCNIRAENGYFLPGEFEKKGKVFADVKTGDHIEFRARLGVGKGGIDTLGVINCVCVAPRLYNPQADMMNPRQMYKQLTWYARKQFADRGKNVFKHHLIPASTIRRSRLSGVPFNLIKCDFKTHYFFHRFLWRWKQTNAMLAAVKTFIWDNSDPENGNSDYKDGHISNEKMIYPRQIKARLARAGVAKKVAVTAAKIEGNAQYAALFGFLSDNPSVFQLCERQQATDRIRWLEHQAKMLNSGNKGQGFQLDGVRNVLEELAKQETLRIRELLGKIFTNMFFYKYSVMEWTQEDRLNTLNLRAELIGMLKINISFCKDFDKLAREVYNKTRANFLDNMGIDPASIRHSLEFTVHEILSEELPEAEAELED